MELFWIVFGTSKDSFQIFCAQTSKQFLWKPVTSPNFKRFCSAYKWFYRVIFQSKFFKNFIWNESELERFGIILELLKTFFEFFASKLQSNSFEKPLQIQTLNDSTGLIKHPIESLFRSKFFKNFISNEGESERFGTIPECFLIF